MASSSTGGRSTSGGLPPGHSVLAIGVPGLEHLVRRRTERYDASFVSADPVFSHAHITLLAPWCPAPTAGDLAAVGTVLAEEPPFAYSLGEVREFAGGVLFLAPEPDGAFRRLTRALAAAFPGRPPYGGRFPHSVPHLTIDHRATGATVASLQAELAGTLPVRAVAEQVELQWWANHDCRVLHRWWLGGTANRTTWSDPIRAGQ